MSRRSGAPRHPTVKLKGGWSSEEDALLTRLVKKFGEGNWSPIARALNEATGKTESTGRIGKQCRERWNHHLSPGLRKDPWTPEEEVMVVDAHRRLGNRWSDIARCIPGRSENAVKNHWNATLRKRVGPENPAGPLKEYLDTLNLSVTPRKRGGGSKRKRGSRDRDASSSEAEPDVDADESPSLDSRATSPSGKAARTASVAAGTTSIAARTDSIAARTDSIAAGAAAASDGARSAPAGAPGGISAAAARRAASAATTAAGEARLLSQEDAAAGGGAGGGGASAGDADGTDGADAVGTGSWDLNLCIRRRSRRLAAQVGNERLRNLVNEERRHKEREDEEDGLVVSGGGGGGARGEYDGENDGGSDGEKAGRQKQRAVPASSYGKAAAADPKSGCWRGPSRTLAGGRGSGGGGGATGGVSRTESICENGLPSVPPSGATIATAAATVAGTAPPVSVVACPVGSSPFGRGGVRALARPAYSAGGNTPPETQGLNTAPSTAGSALLLSVNPGAPVTSDSEAAGCQVTMGEEGGDTVAAGLARPVGRLSYGGLPGLPSLRTAGRNTQYGTAATTAMAAAEHEATVAGGGTGDRGSGGGGGGWQFPYNWSTTNMQTLALDERPSLACHTYGRRSGGGGKVRPPGGCAHMDVDPSLEPDSPVRQANGTHGPALEPALEPAAAPAPRGPGMPSSRVPGGGGVGVMSTFKPVGERTVSAAARAPPSVEEDETCLFLTLAADFSTSPCMRHVASGSALLSYEAAATAAAAAPAAEPRGFMGTEEHPHAPLPLPPQPPMAPASAQGLPTTDEVGPGAAAGGGPGPSCLMYPRHMALAHTEAAPPLRTWTPPNLFDEPHLDFGCPDSPLLDGAGAGAGPAADDGGGGGDAFIMGTAADSSISSVGSPWSHGRETAAADNNNNNGSRGGAAGFTSIDAPGGGAATAVAATVVLKRESSFSGCSPRPVHAQSLCCPPGMVGSVGPASPRRLTGAPLAAPQQLPTAPASPTNWPQMMLQPPSAAAAAAQQSTTATQLSYKPGPAAGTFPPMSAWWHSGVPPPPHALYGSHPLLHAGSGAAAGAPPAPVQLAAHLPPPHHPHPHHPALLGSYTVVHSLPPPQQQQQPTATPAAGQESSLPALPALGATPLKLSEGEPPLALTNMPMPTGPIASPTQGSTSGEPPPYSTMIYVGHGPYMYSWSPYHGYGNVYPYHPGSAPAAVLPLDAMMHQATAAAAAAAVQHSYGMPPPQFVGPYHPADLPPLGLSHAASITTAVAGVSTATDASKPEGALRAM